jgi:hypothetical protein
MTRNKKKERIEVPGLNRRVKTPRGDLGQALARLDWDEETLPDVPDEYDNVRGYASFEEFWQWTEPWYLERAKKLFDIIAKGSSK